MNPTFKKSYFGANMWRLDPYRQSEKPEDVVNLPDCHSMTFLVAHSATQYISLFVCLFVCLFVTLFQIQAIILSLPAYSHLIHFSIIVWPICQYPLVNLPFLWIFWSFNQGSSVTLLFVYLYLKAFLSKKSINAQQSASNWPCFSILCRVFYFTEIYI